MYKIEKNEFKTKKELSNYCRNLVERNLYKEITGDDLNFIMELLKYHDRYDKKVSNMVSMTVKHNKEMYSSKSIFITYKDGSSDDASWTHCINNIKK